MDRNSDIDEKQSNVLYISPVDGIEKRLQAADNLTITTCDLLRDDVDMKLDITNIPYSNNSFDIILCNRVLEHVPDDVVAMEELNRILSPTGWAFIQVPIDENRSETFEDPTVTDPAERERLFGQYDHVRVYGSDYQDRLRSAGFEINQVNPESFVDAEEFDRYSLVNETLNICHVENEQPVQEKDIINNS